MKFKSKHINIKLAIILLAFLLIFIVIIIRLYTVQISQTNFFKDIAEKQYSTEISVMPPRANIYDRYGKNNPLAINKEIMSAFVLPNEMSNANKTLQFLKKNFNNTYKLIKKHPERKFLWVQRNILEKERQLILDHNIKDIHYLKETNRFYPFKDLSPVIGVTNSDNSGISGIELQFNKKLSGAPSTLKIEKDARNNKLFFTQKLVSEGQKGTDINLTIDSNLQFLARKEVKNVVEKFEAKSGSAIIMDPSNGHILSMVNYPYTSEYSKNTIVSDCYEFGSVLKVFLALAALEENITTTDEIIDCEGKVAYIDKFRIENWKPLHMLSFSDVIKHSSNVGTAKIAKRLGHKHYSHLKKLGFGQPTNIQFPGDRTGFLSPPEKWSKSTPFVLSFGYEMNATLLQLAKAFAIISNDGREVQPRLVISDEVQLPGNRIYKQDSIDQLKNILEVKNALQDYRIMGKTGTARLVEDGRYTNKRHVYSYGGIVEKDDYKRVIITFIREPKKTYLWASEVTAPLFKTIAEKMIIYDSTSL